MIVYNLEEQKNNASDLEKFVNILDQADVSCRIGDFRDCYRLGRREENKTRPASIEAISFFLREEILKSAGKLKEKGIYVSFDYTKEEYLDRKLLRKYQQIARNQNKAVEIKNNILFVDGTAFTVEDLRRKETILQETEKEEENPEDPEGKVTSNGQKRKPEASIELLETRNVKKSTLRSGRKFSNTE